MAIISAIRLKEGLGFIPRYGRYSPCTTFILVENNKHGLISYIS
jgi:hypothetical protein